MIVVMQEKTLKQQRKKEKIKYTLISAGTVIVFVLLWQMLAGAGVIDENKLPAPADVFDAFIYKLHSTGPDGATIQENILVSLQVSVTGLALAVVIGIPLGLLMGWYKIFDRFIRPVFEILRPIPPVAWIPLTILWVGVGLGAKAVIIFFSAFVPCVINSYTGIRQTNQTLVNVAKTFGAGNFWMFLHVGVPSSVPMIFAGIRVALANAWGTLVAAEMVAASAGLGYMINMSRNFGRIDVVVLGMVCIGMLGYIFTWLFGKIEKKIMKGRTV